MEVEKYNSGLSLIGKSLHYVRISYGKGKDQIYIIEHLPDYKPESELKALIASALTVSTDLIADIGRIAALGDLKAIGYLNTKDNVAFSERDQGVAPNEKFVTISYIDQATFMPWYFAPSVRRD